MIVAIDPGGTTGIAWITAAGTFATDEVAGGADAMVGWINTWLDTPRGGLVSHVVMETFIPRPGAKSQQLDALHIIGAIRYVCAKQGIALTMQSPAQAKSFADNDKLKAVGWYTVGEDHGRDAARHLLVFVAGPKAGRGVLPDNHLYTPERTRVLQALAAM